MSSSGLGGGASGRGYEPNRRLQFPRQIQFILFNCIGDMVAIDYDAS